VKVAALYDIHGNLPALDAVLDEVERAGVDLIVAGGDLAWSPLPSPTVARLRELGDRCRYLMGNADRGAVADFDRDQSDDAPDAERSQRDFLAGLPPGFVVDVDGLGPTLFCHGSPHSDTQRITTATTDQRLRRILAGVDPRVVVCGHTHRQFDRRLDEYRVINGGSVGLPFEGRRGAFWALLGPDVELRRTDYDLDEAFVWLRAAGMPRGFSRRLKVSLLDPADPDEAAEYFEGLALESESK
jgi:predicted phosphodiesterase